MAGSSDAHFTPERVQNVVGTVRDYLQMRLENHADRDELMQLAEKDEDESKSGSKAAVKALDLLAHNRQTSNAPLPVAFLSGSQRFRVAISLALGIGQFAGSASRGIESVIIDEGFGSLDKQGRHQMIEELHALKKVLSRIILVSHQEEFADAFQTRYVIGLEDGTSRASLFESLC